MNVKDIEEDGDSLAFFTVELANRSFIDHIDGAMGRCHD